MDPVDSKTGSKKCIHIQLYPTCPRHSPSPSLVPPFTKSLHQRLHHFPPPNPSIKSLRQIPPPTPLYIGGMVGGVGGMGGGMVGGVGGMVYIYPRSRGSNECHHCCNTCHVNGLRASGVHDNRPGSLSAPRCLLFLSLERIESRVHKSCTTLASVGGPEKLPRIPRLTRG